MKIYLQMEGEELVELVPLGTYHAIKRQLDSAIKDAGKLRAVAEQLRDEVASMRKNLEHCLSDSVLQHHTQEMLRQNLADSENVFSSFRDAISDALDKAGAPTHLPSIGAPALKPMTPQQRIEALGKMAETPVVGGKTPAEVAVDGFIAGGQEYFPWFSLPEPVKDCWRSSASAVLAAFGNRSQLRPIAEIVPVPEGCVRGWANKWPDGSWKIGYGRCRADTHFADMLLPAVPKLDEIEDYEKSIALPVRPNADDCGQCADNTVFHLAPGEG